MKLLFDLLPVILFFISFKIAGGHKESALASLQILPGADSIGLEQAPILLATVVVMVATMAQIAWVYFRHGKVDKMLWISLMLVMFFGSMTLAFHDEAFIKWKPTVLYWVLAASMLFSLLLRKNPLGLMLGAQIKLPELIWLRINVAWILFFILLGCLNLYIAFNFSTDTWVNFKLFGGMGLMFLFIIAQGIYMMRYAEDIPATATPPHSADNPADQEKPCST